MDRFIIGLGTSSSSVSVDDLRPVAAALNEQASAHVGPIWGVAAEVSLIEDLQNVPTGMSPIIVVDQMPGKMHGVHTMQQNVAFAMVLAAHGWGLAASHECIEMLIDPTGSATRSGRKMVVQGGVLQDIEGTVDYILEACDPVEDESYAYEINGVKVSDFYTPRYFDDAKTGGVRYTYRDQLSRPREVGRNGYLSWHDPVADQLQQLRNFDAYTIVPLEPHAAAANEDAMPTLRCHVDRLTETPRVRHMRRHRLPPRG